MIHFSLFGHGYIYFLKKFIHFLFLMSKISIRMKRHQVNVPVDIFTFGQCSALLIHTTSG